MPRRQAVFAADWAIAEKSNVRVLPNGTAELAVKNLFGNPGLLELGDDGVPVWWEVLISPVGPNGWWVYDKWGSQNGRLNIYGPIPLSQNTFTREDTSYSPITYLQTSTAPADAPTLSSGPSVNVVSASTTFSLASGWYGVALAWTTASEASDGLLSIPSTRDALNLPSAGRIAVTELPALSEAPAGVYGLAVLLTPMQSSEANALNATTALYVQKVYPLSTFPTTAVLSGPLRTDHAATLEAGPDPTGIDEAYLPDTPLAAISTVDPPSFIGPHKIRIAWAFEGGAESAASPQTSVALNSTQTFTVTKPSLSLGTCEVLEDPVDRPAALVGIEHNQIRYFGAVGTPQDFRISRNVPRAVVKAGISYTLWIYAKTNDASQAKLFEMGFRDADGALLDETENFTLATVSGDTAWTLYGETFSAPEDAVFLECLGHEVGEGEILITPPQLNVGPIAAFDNGSVPSGHQGYIIPAWDTSPGEHEHILGLPSGFAAASVEIDDTDGYDYNLSWASSDDSPEDDPASGWEFFADIEDVPFRDYLAAKIEMEKP